MSDDHRTLRAETHGASERPSPLPEQNVAKGHEGEPLTPYTTSNSDVNRYIKTDPNFCPFCGHGVIEATRFDVEGPLAYQWVRCPECETEWHDLFELYGIEEVVAGK
jgi:hypothetical protein|tara:strand:+ start:1730 stop:2050 length:321 start_codon:yes stop_codon:yes gene_type:complete